MERENSHLKKSSLTDHPLESLRSLGAAEAPPEPLRNGNEVKERKRENPSNIISRDDCTRNQSELKVSKCDLCLRLLILMYQYRTRSLLLI